MLLIRVVDPDPDGSGFSDFVDPDPIGNPDPDTDPGARKRRNFSGKMHFLVN
jgi:hypothetical protein